MEPNFIAYVALLVWPLVSLALFQLRPLAQALLWSVLGAYLALPVGTQIKFEMIPVFDKRSIPNLAAFLGCLLVARQPLRFRYGFGAAELLLLTLIAGQFITSQLNTDAIVIGESVRPGVGYYDALSSVVGQLIFLLPFFLARQFLRGPGDNAEVLRVLILGGLAYSLLMLFEIRMSPQLHTWIYGYFPHSFGQQMRDGGFRPVVFLGHGLWVAFFIMTAAVASAAYWRTNTRVMASAPPVAVTGYLAGVLVLCKTLGALAYGAVLVPFVRLATPRLQVRVALVLAAIALSYPMLRAADLFPTTTLIDIAKSIDEERAQSLGFRFENEDRLLDRAWERFLFGWGRFGRNRVFDEETGDDMSVTDGRWIITMGQFGFVGFLAEFGLLALPIVRAASALKFAGSAREEVFLAALAVILAINMIDLLPNASITPWTWLLAGALLGRAEDLRAAARQHQDHWPSRASLLGSR